MIYVSIFAAGVAFGALLAAAISKHEAKQAWRWQMERPDIPLPRPRSKS